jgi:hypothetical protein
MVEAVSNLVLYFGLQLQGLTTMKDEEEFEGLFSMSVQRCRNEMIQLRYPLSRGGLQFKLDDRGTIYNSRYKS